MEVQAFSERPTLLWTSKNMFKHFVGRPLFFLDVQNRFKNSKQNRNFDFETDESNDFDQNPQVFGSPEVVGIFNENGDETLDDGHDEAITGKRRKFGGGV